MQMTIKFERDDIERLCVAEAARLTARSINEFEASTSYSSVTCELAEVQSVLPVIPHVPAAVALAMPQAIDEEVAF